MRILITKMHGLGNSYLIMEDLERSLEQYYQALSRKLSSKDYGIGSDGMLVVNNSKSKIAKYRMRVFNPDGSEAEMSGNGARIFGSYLYRKKLVEDMCTIEAGGSNGGRLLSVEIENEEYVGVDVGEARLLGELTVLAGKRRLKGSRVDVGNPHFVVFEEDENSVFDDALKYGRLIETGKAFAPAGTNAEFVFVSGRHDLSMGVWERGVGVTSSCGSGACAAAYAAVKKNLVENPVQVKVAGGILVVRAGEKKVFLSGPVEYIMECRMDTEDILPQKT